MNKRMTFAALLAAVTIGLTAFTAVAAPAAQAEDCLTVPQLPGECLSQAAYDYIVDLQADELSARQSASWAQADAYQLRTEMWQMAADLQAARQATSIVTQERDFALEGIAKRDRRIAAQRATIKHLRDRLHAII